MMARFFFEHGQEPATEDAMTEFFASKAESQETKDDSATWLTSEKGEGQLAVDVSETDDAFIIETAIAGVDPDDLSIIVNRDMVTIKGRRRQPNVGERSYLFQECYWGDFSRSVLLPSEVKADRCAAHLRRSILTVRLPKRAPTTTKSVAILDEDGDGSVELDETGREE